MKNNYHTLYDVNASIKEKIETIAKEIYRAKDVEYSSLALEKIALYEKDKCDKLPICMAKTPLSLTDNAKNNMVTEGHTIHIKDLSLSSGAGFIVCYTGAIMTMPGLPKVPAAVKMEDE